MEQHHGHIGTLTLKREYPGLEIEVQILDEKHVYGQRRYQVTPIAGSGTVWVLATKVHMLNEERGTGKV